MESSIESNLDDYLESLRFMKRYRKLFITGCPKSGTTWLQKLLNGHPHVVADGEGRFAWLLLPHLQKAILAFNQEQKKYDATPHGFINDAEFALMLRSAADNMFVRYLAGSGKPADQVKIVADKTPQHVLNYGALRAIYPQCQFINIVRDPRDACTSALFHLAKGDPRSREDYITAFITQTWRLHVGAALAAEKQLGANAFLNIRYEDLHADESSVLKRCLDHIAVDSSPAMLAKCSSAGSFVNLSGGRQRGQKDTNSFFRNGTIGDWKNHLDPALAHRCCAQVEPLMKHFGYTIDPIVETTVYVANKPNVAAA